MDLKDKRIVLTGGSSGIGLALLKRLLDEGAHVFAVSRTIETLDYKHPNLIVKNISLSNYEAIDTLFDEAHRVFEQIDIFIANAGFAYYERLKVPDIKHIESLLFLNTHAVIYSAIKMKSHYQERPFRFVATLSAMSYVSMPGYALYGASKAALRGFFDAYQLELSANQMIHTVYPVATKTEFFDRASSEHMPWPVQSSDHVAKTIVSGIKRHKAKIYPSKLFMIGIRYFPWAFKFYIKAETKRFNQTMKG